MKIPKSVLVDPGRNSAYGTLAVAVSIWTFSYSVIFGQALILAYYAVWLPLVLVDYRRFLRHLSSAWLPLLFAAYVCLSVFWSQAPGITARTAIQYFAQVFELLGITNMQQKTRREIFLKRFVHETPMRMAMF